MPCTMYIPVQSANATNQIAAGRQQRAKKENRIPNLEGVHLALSLVPKNYNPPSASGVPAPARLRPDTSA